MPKYIYESPDGGKTVYRYPIGEYDKRELVGGADIDIDVTEDGIVTIVDSGTDS